MQPSVHCCRLDFKLDLCCVHLRCWDSGHGFHSRIKAGVTVATAEQYCQANSIPSLERALPRLMPCQRLPGHQPPGCSSACSAHAQVEHTKEQHYKALKEVQQSEEAAWAEGATRLNVLRDEFQAAARKAERQANQRLEEVTRRVDDLKDELTQREAQRAKLAQAQASINIWTIETVFMHMTIALAYMQTC